MVPMVEWNVLELERTMLTTEQLASKKDTDFGEDFQDGGKGYLNVFFGLVYSHIPSSYGVAFILGNSRTSFGSKHHD